MKRRGFFVKPALTLIGALVSQYSVAQSAVHTGGISNPPSSTVYVDLDPRDSGEAGFSNLKTIKKIIGQGNVNIIFPGGEFFLDFDADSVEIKGFVSFSVVDNKKCILKMRSRSSDLKSFFKISGSGNRLSGIDFRAIDANEHSVIFFFDGISNDNFIENISLSGESAGTAIVHGIFLGNKSSVDNMNIVRSIFTGLSFGIFSSNAFDGRATNWRIEDCRFLANRADDIELNSENNSNIPWRNVLIRGNYFHSERKSIVSSNGFAIGLESTFDVKILHNSFLGYLREAIHIEDFNSSIMVSSNSFQDCFRAISVYEEKTSDVIISNNFCRNSRYLMFSQYRNIAPNDSRIAINIVNPGRFESAQRVSIIGNVISGFDVGVYSPIGRGGVVSQNIVSDCNVGVYVPRTAENIAIGNKFYKNNCAFAGFPFEIKSNDFDNCQAIIPDDRSSIVSGVLNVSYDIQVDSNLSSDSPMKMAKILPLIKRILLIYGGDSYVGQLSSSALNKYQVSTRLLNAGQALIGDNKIQIAADDGVFAKFKFDRAFAMKKLRMVFTVEQGAI